MKEAFLKCVGFVNLFPQLPKKMDHNHFQPYQLENARIGEKRIG